MFTSGGDIGLFILTLILQFMVTGIGRRTVLYHAHEKGCARQGWPNKSGFVTVFSLK